MRFFFYLADDKCRNEIVLTDWSETFYLAQKAYNEASKKARNVKKIIDMKIDEKEIKIILESNSILEKPTLALRSFSQYLVNTEFGEIATVNNALFRGSFENISDIEDNISGPEMVKTLVEIIMSNRETDEDTIKQIKEILIDWRSRK